MLVFRRDDSNELSYAGAATSWIPPEPLGRTMRQSAIRVGEHLRATIGYRGSFTMDGVATEAGFLPTELNPRFGGALNRVNQGLPGLPLYLLHLATAEGLQLEYRPDELERLVLQQLDPVVRGMQLLEGRFDLEPRTLEIMRDAEQEWRPAEDNETPSGTILLGPSGAGSILFVSLDADQLQTGVSTAPALCSALGFADRLWNLGIGPLLPAPDLTSE
jgi:hypothetical protein